MTATECTTGETVQITKISHMTLRELASKDGMPCKRTGKNVRKVIDHPSEAISWLFNCYKKGISQKLAASAWKLTAYALSPSRLTLKPWITLENGLR
jgi:hypothetical protein